MNDYLIDILVEAILADICKDTSEWSDPTGEKACKIATLSDINTPYNEDNKTKFMEV